MLEKQIKSRENWPEKRREMIVQGKRQRREIIDQGEGKSRKRKTRERNYQRKTEEEMQLEFRVNEFE